MVLESIQDEKKRCKQQTDELNDIKDDLSRSGFFKSQKIIFFSLGFSSKMTLSLYH